MKKFIFFAFAVLAVLGFSVESYAQRVRLRSSLNPTCSATSQNLKFADIYADGNIAVQGTYSCRGAMIYNVTNPDEITLSSHYDPIRPGTASTKEQFLEAIVIGNRGYFGSGNGGGVYIVDLTNPAAPALLGRVTSTSGNGFNSIHEMNVIDQGPVRLLIENDNNGTNLLRVINVTNPANPVFVRTIDPLEVNWVHAMHVRGNRMYTSGWGNGAVRGRTEIWDITNLSTQAPTILGFIEDPAAAVTNGNSMHSSWTSEDGNFLYSAREIGNSASVSPGDVRVYDISNPATPVMVNRVSMADLGINASTPHNPVVMGNKLYVAWYHAGLQLFDISVVSSPRKIGEYDTYPQAFVPEEVSTEELGGKPWDVVCGQDPQNRLISGYEGLWAVYPFLGEDKVLIGDLAKGIYVLDVSGRNPVSDFDGDGKTDFSVFRPSTGDWVVEKSSDSSQSTLNWGLTGDIITPGDYDGDGKTDHAIFRPSTGTWWSVLSSNGARPAVQFGLNGDIPVPADYDGDGKTDVAVWRPSTGVWYINQSSGGIRYQTWGIETDTVFSGDHDGDGKSDLVVWRPSNGVWYVLRSLTGTPAFYTFGTTGDKPLFADFDGDSRSEFSVYRPSTGVWYSINSMGGVFTAYQFGLADDVPIPADYDGDGKTDIAVFRPGTNVWYRVNSSGGSISIRAFGTTGDEPSPSSVQP